MNRILSLAILASLALGCASTPKPTYYGATCLVDTRYPDRYMTVEGHFTIEGDEFHYTDFKTDRVNQCLVVK
jgi:hypothetical protein